MSEVKRQPHRVYSNKTSPARSIAVNASIVAGAFVLSRILGLLREILIARQFGTSPEYDAYVAAFRIPDLLFLVVMSGAFGSAFIPVFGGFVGRGDWRRAWLLANTVLTYTVIVLLIISQVVFLFAGTFIDHIVAPGLNEVQRDLAIDLTRLLLLSPLLLGIGAAAKGMLEAQDLFTLPAIAPVIYNVGIIFGAVVLAPSFGAYGLAYGVIAGAMGHAGIQIVGLLRGGMRYKPSFSMQTEGLNEVGRLMLPRIFGQAAFQINIIVITNFASRLGDSRVAAIHYAQSLFMLPHAVLAMSLSTVIFPLMSRQFATGRLEEMKDTLDQALGPLLFLTLPATVGLIAYRSSIVQTVLQFGTFSSESTELVATALGYLAIGLAGFAVVEAITRAFYAMHDTRTPVLAAILTVASNIGLSWYLAPILGHGGLALSLALTTSIEALVLLVILRNRIGGIGNRLLISILRSGVAAVIMAGVALWLADPLAQVTDPSTGRSLSSLLAFVVTLGATFTTYLVAAYYLRSPELQLIYRQVRRRLPASLHPGS